MAQKVADSMVADKKAALDKVQKAKSKGGNTIAEKIAAEKERKANIAKAQQELDAWKAIASVSETRQQAMAEAQAQAEAERIKAHIPQTEEIIGRSLSADEAQAFIADMELTADVAPEIDLTIENWDALFGESGTVNTPIGEVKMGENQFAKLMRADRNGKLGMIKPTLEHPHAIVEDASEAKGDNVTKRASSYVFIRSFKKADGSRYYYFTSVTVSKDGKEVVISNQEKSKKRISNLLQNGVISWINKNVQSVSEAQSEESVLLDDSQTATQADNNTVSLGINSSELSESKDTTSSQNNNELEAENVQSAEAEEEARRKPLRERISQWSKKTGVKVNFIEKFEDVKHKAPKEAIAEGKIVDGWFDKETGEVYFYMPHLSDAKNADLTFIHEVVSHKGMEALLGKKGYDALCDAVWNSMSEKARKTFENYPGVSNIKSPIKRRRAAADEYIAHLAEKTDLTKAEKLIWSKIVDFIREALNALGMNMKVSDAELSMLIRAAYAKMVQEAKKNANTAEQQMDLREVDNAEEGDIRFSAKRKSRATEIDETTFNQTKQEVNREIDQATGLFISGGARAAKAIRKQKEMERKALATEIYSKVLAGDFNPLTLQQIEKYINDVTPRNPFGRRISQRVPQKVERSVYGGKSKGAIDLLFSRISESSVPASRRNSEEGRRAIEERKKEALKGWAIATGNWHTDLSDFTNDKEPFAQGTDSKVYASKDGGYVIKASKGKPYGKRFRADIDNVALFNHIFPNSKYEILGYGEIDGNFVRILRQPIVDFSEDAYLTEDERVAYMAELDFKPLNKENTAFSNGDFVAADLQKANIVRDSKGNIRVIDADMKLHTTDIGGNYSYAPVEEDVLSDNEVNSRVHSAEEGDIRFRVANESQEIFVSNAQKAVEGIKQDKATPQQWLAMIQKQGGLKAGEDRWMGLSEWLQGTEAKTLTKQEVLDFIEANKIEIEEVNYGESEVSQFEDSDIYNEWAELGGDEDAFNEMIERYGDDFEMAFLYDEGQLYVADEDAASFFIDKGAETINETRLSYTTEGLTDNREIALTVPTIEPYNQNDDIHFGDAGGGRAVAWVRFGDTKDANGNDVLVIDEIQSVRHQDGREKGYRNEEIIALENSINSLHEKMYGEGLAPEEYRELTRLREEQREIIINANPELKAESEKVKELEKEYEALKKDNQSKLDSEGVELARLQTLQEDARSIAEYDRIEKEIQDIKDAADKRKAELNEFFNVTIGNAYDKLHKGIRNDLSNQVYGVPVAPFEKNWHELAMKRMLRYAAENGYDKVAWTTGAQQAARYDMRQQVDNIQVEENNIEEFNDGTPIAKNITINTPRGNKIRYQADSEGNIRGGEYGGKNLKDVVCKELAEKIMQPGSFTIEEEGLAIGGEGMKGFYDKMLPSFVQKYTKKWGAKVGTVELPDLEEGSQQMWSVDVTDSMKDDVMEGQVMFRISKTPEEFDATQKEAVENVGIVMPNLSSASVKIVDVPRHDFTGRGIDAIRKAKAWAKNNIVGEHTYHKNKEDEFAYTIEEKAVEKFLSSSSTGNSTNLGVHLAALKKLPSIVENSIDVEIHPDYKKKDNIRKPENGIGRSDMLIHRMYGAVRIDGQIFRAKTTIHEFRGGSNDVYDYKITKIELIVSGPSTDNARTNSTFVDGTNLLDKVEKSYDKGVKVLAASEDLTIDNNGVRMKVEDQWQDMLTDKEREAMQTEHDAVDEGGYGLDSPEVRESIHQKIDERYKAKAMKRNDSDGNVRMSARESLGEAVERIEQQSEQNNVADWMTKQSALRAISGEMNQLRRAMSAQRKYDLTTVKAITRLAKEMLTNGMLDGTSQYSVRRILGTIERAHGKQDVSIEVKTLMDVMIDTQLQQRQKALQGMLSIKGSKVNAKGIEVQGKLDADGVAVVKAFKNAMGLPKESVENQIAEAMNRMGSQNEAVLNAIEARIDELIKEYESRNGESVNRDGIRLRTLEDDSHLNQYAVENIFGGIWIRTKQEYAKFASAVES